MALAQLDILLLEPHISYGGSSFSFAYPLPILAPAPASPDKLPSPLSKLLSLHSVLAPPDVAMYEVCGRLDSLTMPLLSNSNSLSPFDPALPPVLFALLMSSTARASTATLNSQPTQTVAMAVTFAQYSPSEISIPRSNAAQSHVSHSSVIPERHARAAQPRNMTREMPRLYPGFKVRAAEI